MITIFFLVSPPSTSFGKVLPAWPGHEYARQMVFTRDICRCVGDPLLSTPILETTLPFIPGEGGVRRENVVHMDEGTLKTPIP
jgi:hypothetical protein